jgi:prepilin-type N-terminal cleavage/methylation domain-containing protein
MTPGRVQQAFTLLEVLVALVVLEVCLLGVLGLFTLAGRTMVRAVLVERAAAEVAAVADSLTRVVDGASGESRRGEWRITWEALGSEGFQVSAHLAAAERPEPVLELRVP